MFRENYGNDPLDTFLGVFSELLLKLVVWLGCGVLGLLVGASAAAFFGVVLEFWETKDLSATLMGVDVDNIRKALLALPSTWLFALISSVMHPVGLVCLPVTFLGGFMFLSSDRWEEELLFAHLLTAPWLGLVVAGDAALLTATVCLAWSLMWGYAWWWRERTRRARELEEEAIHAATEGKFNINSHIFPTFPEINITVREEVLDTTPLPFPPRPATREKE